MSVIHLTPDFIAHGLQCPEGKTRVEFCDTEASSRGLYIEVSASTPGLGIYRLRYKDATGKTCHAKLGRTSEITLDAARKQAAVLKAQIAIGTNPKAAEKPKELNFHDYFYDVMLPYIKPRLRSWKRSEELFRLRIDGAFGLKKLDQINRHEMQVFLTGLLASGLRPASVNHHAKLCRHALNLAVEWGMLEKNPLSRLPLFQEDNKVERYMDDKQLGQLLNVLKTDENRVPALICMWLLSTGARCGEALKATWAQVDEANRVWRVPASNTKARKVRAIPLNDSALQVLQQARELNYGGEYVFVNKKTGKPYTTIVKTWTNMRIKAGLPHVRIHDLRHQYASFLVNAGRTLFEVQQILGHSDPSVTQRYSHLSTKSLSEAANSASIAIRRGMEVAAA